MSSQDDMKATVSATIDKAFACGEASMKSRVLFLVQRHPAHTAADRALLIELSEKIQEL